MAQGNWEIHLCVADWQGNLPLKSCGGQVTVRRSQLSFFLLKICLSFLFWFSHGVVQLWKFNCSSRYFDLPIQQSSFVSFPHIDTLWSRNCDRLVHRGRSSSGFVARRWIPQCQRSIHSLTQRHCRSVLPLSPSPSVKLRYLYIYILIIQSQLQLQEPSFSARLLLGHFTRRTTGNLHFFWSNFLAFKLRIFCFYIFSIGMAVSALW